LWSFGIFFPLWYVCKRKIWQPWQRDVESWEMQETVVKTNLEWVGHCRDKCKPHSCKNNTWDTETEIIIPEKTSGQCIMIMYVHVSCMCMYNICSMYQHLMMKTSLLCTLAYHVSWQCMCMYVHVSCMCNVSTPYDENFFTMYVSVSCIMIMYVHVSCMYHVCAIYQHLMMKTSLLCTLAYHVSW
jgi:hypothetical protein